LEKRNWYVIQVITGDEELCIDKCIRKLDPGIYEKCFVPYYIRKKKYLGRWNEEKYKLYPGYIFVISDNIEEVFLQLKKVDGLTKLLSIGDEIIPIEIDEAMMIKKMIGDTDTVEMSVGFIVGDKVVIQSGPLKGMESKIKKIDRHKKIAIVSMAILGNATDVTVGLEVVKKIDDEENDTLSE